MGQAFDLVWEWDSGFCHWTDKYTINRTTEESEGGKFKGGERKDYELGKNAKAKAYPFFGLIEWGEKEKDFHSLE